MKAASATLCAPSTSSSRPKAEQERKPRVTKRKTKNATRSCVSEHAFSRRVRARQIDDFHGAGVPVMLLSLKCGVGLNLTVANTVVLCEPWWNPYVEEQAIDRVHRIGQTKPVRVLRLAVPDTVEDRILRLQESKRGRTEQTLGDAAAPGAGAAAANSRLSERDLRRLFRVDDDDDF